MLLVILRIVVPIAIVLIIAYLRYRKRRRYYDNNYRKW